MLLSGFAHILKVVEKNSRPWKSLKIAVGAGSCLFKRGYEHRVKDGKEHGLKIFEKRANVFKVLMLNIKKWTENIMFSAPWWKLFDVFFVTLQSAFLYAA